MKPDRCQYWPLAAAAWLLLIIGEPVFAEQAADSAEDSTAGYASVSEFGGPSSVAGQLKSDHEKRSTPYWFHGASRHVQPYYDLKKRLDNNRGLAFGADYNLFGQWANESLGDQYAIGGVIRGYATWALVGRGTQDTGSLTVKVENRHALTDVAPQQLGAEVGYVGLTAIPFSDAGTVLTNAFWSQSFYKNHLAFIAGIVDVTDYVAVYSLVNSWTDFSNLAFSTDPTIPAPNQGLGASVRGTFKGNLYLLAGVADANGDPGDPLEGFDTFFNEHETFKHIEFGWYGNWKNRFNDNIHLTVWQVDEREAAQVPDGWGAAFSFSRLFNKQWLPFARAGYADGGGPLLARSLSVGTGYLLNSRSDMFGLGLNWGRPFREDGSPDRDNQYTTEFFYNFQLFQHMILTPDIQWIVNPADNPDEDRIWVLGLRARLSF